MDGERTGVRRKQITGQLAEIVSIRLPQPPRGGWIKSIRESLGMTLDSLAQRVDKSRQAVNFLEQSEARGTITLLKLQEVAHGLDCDVVYLLVPRVPLEENVRTRARIVAERRAEYINHTMRLEDQTLTAEAVEGLVDPIADDLVMRRDQSLWRL